MSDIAVAMGKVLAHRGPDDSGVWSDDACGVGFVHRRLSILDLTSAGHQPMQSSCGRYVLVFNGEIYNHLDLRARLLKGARTSSWRGHSDTETLLAACAAWGIERTLQATVGMFAFALWDRQTKSLTLARDRAGEKPLYYGWQKRAFLFASELKALKEHPSFCAEIDRGALALMMRHNCVPAPYSIYSGIQKLMPGHYLTIQIGHDQNVETYDLKPYWRLNDVVTAGLANPFEGTDEEAICALESQLLTSVGSQLISDVPLGAFLSGGVDSSTIVALMQAQSSRPVNTFTIGFESKNFDEAVHAKAVAQHLGTSHTELYVSSEDALAVIPKLAEVYCEPFSDSSQIPTYLVSALASDHVKVALSGDGGDELFGGYNRYLSANKAWSRIQRLPVSSRKAIARLLKSASPAGWDKLFAAIGFALPDRWRLRTPGEKAHKLASVLLTEDGVSFYHSLVSHWQNPEHVVRGSKEPPTLITCPDNWPRADCLAEWMMAMDTHTYLPDDILTKVDRAAMANSLETRVPLLDHRVVELAWRMPLTMKVRQSEGKWLLRQVLAKYVPKSLTDRPKTGFANPLHEWLRGPLREWAEELLSEIRLRDEGFFNPEPVRDLWRRHLSGNSNEQYPLWDVLMFQAWLQEQ